MLEAPSPKSHAYVWIVPVDVSVNCTAKGLEPLEGLAEKFATGGGSETVIVVLFVSDPPGPVTVNLAVNDPALV